MLPTVTIHRFRKSDGVLYEIKDYTSYVHALAEHGITAPQSRYQVFVSAQDEQRMRQLNKDVERQLALFFRLEPHAGINYRFVDAEIEAAPIGH
ncbi:MAG: hypothetical protein HY000_11960 [Planctomycetes bacterium]|nr:hypothetical protein [Planctomycetota bacterium]